MKKLILFTFLFAQYTFAADLITASGFVSKVSRLVHYTLEDKTQASDYIAIQLNGKAKTYFVEANDDSLTKVILSATRQDMVTLYYDEQLVKTGANSFENGYVVKAVEIIKK